jgi:hypothetical protein
MSQPRLLFGKFGVGEGIVGRKLVKFVGKTYLEHRGGKREKKTFELFLQSLAVIIQLKTFKRT